MKSKQDNRAIGSDGICHNADDWRILAFAQHSAQDEILAQSQQELEDDLEGQIVWTAPGRDSLYKDSEFVDADILQQVCEKYGLNYDTVTLREVSREAFDYEYALNAKSTEGEKPCRSWQLTSEISMRLRPKVPRLSSMKCVKRVIWMLHQHR